MEIRKYDGHNYHEFNILSDKILKNLLSSKYLDGKILYRNFKPMVFDEIVEYIKFVL